MTSSATTPLGLRADDHGDEWEFDVIVRDGVDGDGCGIDWGPVCGPGYGDGEYGSGGSGGTVELEQCQGATSTTPLALLDQVETAVERR